MEFIRHLQDQTVTEIPTSVTFECELSKANVKVVWQCGDTQISSTPKYDIQVDGTVHRLVVREVSGTDVTQYTALARGKTSTAKLIIQGESVTVLNFSYVDVAT